MTEITFNQSPADAAVKVLIATKEEALNTALPAVLSAAPFLISSKPLSNARMLPATKRKFWFLTP